MSSSPKIGIGITTYKRPALLQQCLAEFNVRLPPNSILFVNDDSERAEGIAAAKNRCLDALEHCDYIFLFDDDIWPCKDKWWEPFIKGSVDYNCHVFSSSWNISTMNYVVARKGSLLSLKWTCGVCVFLTKKVVETIGGYNIMFGKWGGEHEEYAQRAWLNGLAPYKLCDLEGSIDNFMSLDKQNQITSTLAHHYRTPQRTALSYIDRNDPSWKPYMLEDMCVVPENIPPAILKCWASHSINRILVPYKGSLPENAATAHNISYLNTEKESLINYLRFYKQYIRSLTIANPVCCGLISDASSSSIICSAFGDSEYEQKWLYRMPQISVSSQVRSPAYIKIPQDHLDFVTHYLLQTQLPAYMDSPAYAAVNMLSFPTSIHTIDLRPIVMICGTIDRKEELIEAINHYSSPLWHTIGVVGVKRAAATVYCEDSRVVELPIMSEKKLEIIWKGSEWILQKWPTVCGIYKTDSNTRLNDIERLTAVITINHTTPFWLIRTQRDVGFYMGRGMISLLMGHYSEYTSATSEEAANSILLKQYNIQPDRIHNQYIDTGDVTFLS